MNKLKAERKLRGLTLDDLAKATNIKRGTLNNYENNKTEPKLATWEKLADYFNVPVDYLQGLSNDKVGWHLWEDATGYKKETIESQISQLKKFGKISENESIQKQIGLAVSYLDGRGKTDRNAIETASMELSELDNRIHDDFYIDPNKTVNEEKLGNSRLRNMKTEYDGSLYYDDMHKEVYDKISDILQEARQKLADLEN
ncbi:helix-turn-helix domain-containing protein [Pediococcus ethanolidurans]|uniref:helix-turn-helix domain-containing protein n=1 Tax=Pediococcus ethanolidurans TaxID=319653 RepID=UPI001C1EC400|nr:helix-turn-helix transcriptional regulator [Pediococcus ethanolidurans]MBU7554477.1 helix-turn-helix domain-containing protein [Pediococcus ethanolidurans]